MLMLTRYEEDINISRQRSSPIQRETRPEPTRRIPTTDESTSPGSNAASDGFVQVVIGRKEGELHVNLSDVSFIQQVGTGTAIGGALGSIIPGIGNSVGSVVGAIGGVVSRWFGVGKGERRSVRHTLRAVFQETIASASASIIETPYRETASYSDCVTLKGEYVPTDVQKMVEAIFDGFISQLKPGTDEYNDIANAYHSLRYVKGRHTDICILKFREKHITDGRNGNSPAGSAGAKHSGNSGFGTVNPENVSGFGGIKGAAILAGILIFGSR